MAINRKEIEEFNDMFELSSNKTEDNNEQTEEYGFSTEPVESFGILAKEISEEIQENENKGYSLVIENPHDIVKEVCSDGGASISVVEDVEDVEDDFFDDLSVTSAPVVEESVKDIISKDFKTEIFTEDSFCDGSELDYGEVGDGDDKIEWMLKSPSSMYNSFYQKKRDLLFRYMVGGQIEYKRWTQELEEAKVTIQGEVFDHQLIINQMEAVQQYRERVKFIHVKVNNQYFTFKRFVEMMRGFMARIEYLKPVIRQEGLIMEHMRDLELYYARLEALHDSATKTEKTLAAAFDTLSRKCTICMELKPAERVELKTFSSSTYTPPIPPLSREESSEFDEFDDLPSNAQAIPTGYKTGTIGWGDI